jgi:hypothetical protein
MSLQEQDRRVLIVTKEVGIPETAECLIKKYHNTNLKSVSRDRTEKILPRVVQKPFSVADLVFASHTPLPSLPGLHISQAGLVSELTCGHFSAFGAATGWCEACDVSTELVGVALGQAVFVCLVAV